MALQTRSVLIGLTLVTVSIGLAWAEERAPQRDDPATSGAGPTSGAPGLYSNDPPKGGSVTIDSSGVRTFQPTERPSQSDPPVDRDAQGSAPRAPK
jgi:hypothetical protein